MTEDNVCQLLQHRVKLNPVDTMFTLRGTWAEHELDERPTTLTTTCINSTKPLTHKADRPRANYT